MEPMEPLGLESQKCYTYILCITGMTFLIGRPKRFHRFHRFHPSRNNIGRY
jgi:hypothetical protein